MMSIALFSVFIVAMLVGIPITFALGLGVFAAILVSDLSLVTAAQRMVPSLFDAFVLIAIPLFIFAGNLIGRGGMGDRLVKLANILIGRTRGGLSSVNIVTSMFFGGVSGSATADTSAIGTVLIPAMEKQGYDKGFATAVTVVSSPLGVIIPPSILIIVYAWITEMSIATLFAAGYLPAFILGISLMITGYIISVKNKYPTAPRYSGKEVLIITLETIPGLLTPIIIVGGIVGGIFTATEAASVAVVYGFIISKYFYKDLKWSDLPGILVDTVKLNGIVILIIAFAAVFGWIIAYDRLPVTVAQFIASLEFGNFGFLVIYIIFLLILGTFLAPIEAVIISTPILFPVSTLIGIDPVHFGMVTVMALALGHVTPPVGLCLFVGSAISGLSIGHIVRSLIPFYIVSLIVVILVAFFPKISLILPQLFDLL